MHRLSHTGTISPYQPGLTSVPQLTHFTQSPDVDYQDSGYVPPAENGYYTPEGDVTMAPTGTLHCIVRFMTYWTHA